jgi:integrase
MAKETLADTRVRSLVAKGEPIDLLDRIERGLVLRVRRPGVASYSFLYSFKGRLRRLTIGRTDAVSLAGARAEALECRANLRKGIDPIEKRAADKAAKAAEDAQVMAAEEAKAARITVSWALDRYIADSSAASRRNGKGPPRERIRTLNVDVRPQLGGKALADLTNADVMGLVQAAITNGRERKPSKLYDEMRAFLNWAAGVCDPPLITGSPLVSKRPEQNEARDRILSVPEIRAFLVSLPACAMTDPVRDILRLILRLGQRVNEVAAMRKREVHLADDFWAISARRAKNRRANSVPLPPSARALIIAASNRSTCDWVFPNKSGDGPLDPGVVMKALLRSRATFGFVTNDGEPNPFSSHDLRRTCATYLERLGTPEKVIARILNHKSVKEKNITSSVYARDDLFEPAYDALVKWESALELIEKGEDPFNVTVADRRLRAAMIRSAMLAAGTHLENDDHASNAQRRPRSVGSETVRGQLTPQIHAKVSEGNRKAFASLPSAQGPAFVNPRSFK